MRIFSLEVKKLLNWKVLLMIAVFSALLYSRCINNYCFQYGSSYGTAMAALGKEILQKYGPDMDADEQQDFADH